MTYIENGVFIVTPENPQQCDFCGRIAELRPYGPKGECICSPCGMKDEAAAMRQLNARIDRFCEGHEAVGTMPIFRNEGTND